MPFYYTTIHLKLIQNWRDKKYLMGEKKIEEIVEAANNIN